MLGSLGDEEMWMVINEESYWSKIRLTLKMTTLVFFYVKRHSQPSPPITVILSTYSLPKEKGHLHQTIQEKIQIVSKLKGICIHLLWGNCPIFWPHGAMHTVQRVISPHCSMCCINHLTSFLPPHPNVPPHCFSLLSLPISFWLPIYFLFFFSFLLFSISILLKSRGEEQEVLTI